MVPSRKKEGDDKTSGRGYSKHLVGAGMGVLVMALALVAIAAAYSWFGHIGSSFSTSVMEKQQARLRQQYGLPPEPPLPPKLLEVPPSLRNVTTNGEGTEVAANGSSSASTADSNTSAANNSRTSSTSNNNNATGTGP